MESKRPCFFIGSEDDVRYAIIQEKQGLFQSENPFVRETQPHASRNREFLLGRRE